MSHGHGVPVWQHAKMMLNTLLMFPSIILPFVKKETSRYKLKLARKPHSNVMLILPYLNEMQ